MTKKKIIPFLDKQYRKLSKSEKDAQKRLLLINDALCAFISVIVKDAYLRCQVNGKTDFSRLFHRISQVDIRDLKSRIRRARMLYGDGIRDDDFPFSLTKFDRLNRLDLYRAQIIVACVEAGADQRKVIYDHLLDYSYLLVTELATYIGVTAVVAGRISDDAVKTDGQINKSIYNNMLNTAASASINMQQALTRGDSLENATKMVADVVGRKTKRDTDRLLFTEGTRTTNEAVKQVVEPYAKYFYCVPVLDNKTCQVCIDISEEQKKNPVPMEDFVVGVTAPPFHPWCRCRFEVIFK